MTAQQQQKRKVWVDWMKALGMLAIIWGHCFPDGMTAFVYAFNVPVFFVISGYLTRPEPTFGQCFQKTLHNLIIPYFILAFIKAADFIFQHLTDGQWLWSLVAIVSGFHTLNDATGCNNLWFVYTLILIKFVYQLLPHRRLLLSLLALMGTWLYGQTQLDWAWGITNMLPALPFFMLGNALRESHRFAVLTEKMCRGSWTNLLLAAGCAALVYAVSLYNGPAYLYQAHYGANMWLFVIASVAGCAMVWLLSTALDRCDWRAVSITSAGTIVTLVFHRELLHEPLKLIRDSHLDIVTANLAWFFLSVLVLLAFIPIILIVKRLFPIVLGRRAKNL